MNGRDLIWTLGNIALYLAIPGLITFVVIYATRSRWKEFVAGRSIMNFMVALALVALSGTLVTLFGEDYVGREWVRLALYCSISYAIWRLVIVVIKIQNRPPRSAEEIRAALELLLMEEKKHPTKRHVGEVHLNENVDQDSIPDLAEEKE